MPDVPVGPGEDGIAKVSAALGGFEDDGRARKSLRALSMQDPPRGAPMAVPVEGAPPGEVQLIEPGRWREVGYVNLKTGLPLNCPVKPLGKYGSEFYFLNPLGQVETVPSSSSGKGNFDGLFAGRTGYLPWAWPRWSATKKGESPRVENWAAEDARQDLFDACAFIGAFKLEDQVRGRGAWANDLDGSLIYHAGDVVWIGGEWRDPGEHDGLIYPGGPALRRPALAYEPAGEGSAGRVLLDGLLSWNWARGEIDARLALGWIVTALVGGALDERPVIYVVGSEGVGKSTFLNTVQELMGGALVRTANATQAGVYHTVRQDSVAVLVDENEPKEDTRGTDKLMELARIAYSGDRLLRGSKDGVGQSFAVRSSFMFSSVALPPLEAQDASRMAILMMREREAGAADVLAELGLRDATKLARIGAVLLRRVFDWFRVEGGRTRWAAARAAIREALKQVGHEDRSADVFGALAAGCHVALGDAAPDAEALRQWQGWLAPELLAETAGRQKTWQRCVWHLMDAKPDVLLRTSSFHSVGHGLEAFKRDAAELTRVLAALRECGLTLRFRRGDPPEFAHAWLFVPATSAALHDLFAGTPWAGRPGQPGPWSAVLRQAPEHHWREDTTRRLGAMTRGMSLRLVELAAEARAPADEDEWREA